MAFYIEMDRAAETEEYVEYTFGRGVEVGLSGKWGQTTFRTHSENVV